jgi:hypothetical protein
MTVARVVTFEDVSEERIDEIRRSMSDGTPPEGLPVTEAIILHEPGSKKSIAILFFESDEDYEQGDATMNAMDRGDTPGTRTSVTKYNVAIHMKH